MVGVRDRSAVRRRGRAGWGLIALGMLISLALPVDAGATNFTGATFAGGCTGNVADNRSHFFWYSGLTATTTAAVNWSRTNNYDPTDINTANSGGQTNLTDVVVFDEDYEGLFCGRYFCCNNGSGWIGFSSCQSLTPPGRCEQDFLYFDLDFMGPQTTVLERSLACHEIGHSVGLMHRSGSCMQDPLVSNPALSDHDRAHINNYTGYNS
jgi:hypothetical protein